MSSSHRFRIGASVISLFHIVGLIGLNLPTSRLFFEHISWVTMLLTLALLIWCFEDAPVSPLICSALVIYTVSMVVEIAGVYTGAIFGAYHYTPTLGWALMGVPLIIGGNWIALTYTGGVTSSLLPLPIWGKVMAGAAIMTFSDMLLEGFAIRHHLWVWDATGSPPLQNFIAWFCLSLLLQATYQWLLPTVRNRLAVFYLFVFFAFVVADRFLG